MIRGAAAVDRNVAYFMSCGGQLFSYDSSTQRMSKLPQCPHWSSSLVIVRCLLTAIGSGNDL